MVAWTAGYGLVASALVAGTREDPTETLRTCVGLPELALHVINGKPTG